MVCAGVLCALHSVWSSVTVQGETSKVSLVALPPPSMVSLLQAEAACLESNIPATLLPSQYQYPSSVLPVLSRVPFPEDWYPSLRSRFLSQYLYLSLQSSYLALSITILVRYTFSNRGLFAPALL